MAVGSAAPSDPTGITRALELDAAEVNVMVGAVSVAEGVHKYAAWTLYSPRVVNELMGILADGKTTTPAALGWIGATSSYSFTPVPEDIGYTPE